MADPNVRILVADAISEAGIDLLRETEGFDVDVRTGMAPDELKKAIGDYEAMIVRSATKVTADVLQHCGTLRAIGRAGTGVDNIDLTAATEKGVVVMNTPGGNSVAAAELTLSLLLALARNVPQANADLRAGRWERKKYMGTEVAGKTLGVIGLGRIGREVARMAQGFRMNVVGYDPFVTAEVAANFGVCYAELDELVASADFITLHLPRTEETHHLIGRERLAKVKPGCCIVNCARGGLIDEPALFEALEDGRVAGAALDVFETEPPTDRRLVDHPRVVSTPHLGASTREAQLRVGTEIAGKIRDFIRSGIILDAVNFPPISRQEFATLGPVMDLANRLGTLAGQIAQGAPKKLELRQLGRFADESGQPVLMAAVKGLLSSHVEGAVSFVNALDLARQRGLQTEQSATTDGPTHFAALLRLRVETDRGETLVSGTLYGNDEPRVVEIDKVAVECLPSGHMLVIHNQDVPGVIGQLGRLLGEADVNIGGLQLGRLDGTDRAISIVLVDSPVPADTVERIRQIPEVTRVTPARI